MSRIRFVALVGIVAGLGTGSSRAQVQSNPNQIQGTFHFANTNPAALAILETFPVIDGTAMAEHPALGTARTDVVPATGGGCTFELSVQATPDGAPHELTMVMSIAPLAEADIWRTNPRMSPPVFPEPAPDVPVDLSECAALVRVTAVDAAGARMPWPNASIISTAGSFSARSTILYGPMEDYLVLPVVPDPWQILFYVAGHLDVTTTIGPVGCDEIAEVEITLFPSDPGTSTTCTVTGQLDFVGEVEGLRQLFGPPTKIQEQFGRVFHFTTAPAEGAFQLDDVVSRVTYATAYTHVRGFNRYQEVSVVGQWFDCPPDSITDLGNMFVIEPALMRGDIFVAGPPERSEYDSALRNVVRAISDEEGVFYSWSMDSSSKVSANGTTGTLGSTCCSTRGLFQGDFNARTAAFEGDYELVVGAPSTVSATYSLGMFDLLVSRTSGRGPVLGTSMHLRNRLLDRVAIPPGGAADQDQRYCTSEVEFAFVSSAGLFQRPSVDASGDMVGTNFEGDAADYHVYASASGEGDLPPATTGSVRALLAEGDYAVDPRIEILNPGGGTTRTTLPQFQVTVGCREQLRVFDTLQVRLTSDLAACSGGPVRIQGVVAGGAVVARLAWRLGSGPETVACAPCGVDPAFDFSVPLEPGDNEVVVEAIDDAGRLARAVVLTRLAIEPSALDRDPVAAPLRVTRDPSGAVRLTWERTQFDYYAPHRGTLDALWSTRSYDHSRIGPCDLTEPEFIDESSTDGYYYLVTAGCGLVHGSYGRDSRGAERPTSPNSCP